jgi:hypothetical protein
VAYFFLAPFFAGFFAAFFVAIGTPPPFSLRNSSNVMFDIAEIERLVKFFFSFFVFDLDRPDIFIRLRFSHRMPY